jgi:hypothetical protein
LTLLKIISQNGDYAMATSTPGNERDFQDFEDRLDDLSDSDDEELCVGTKSCWFYQAGVTTFVGLVMLIICRRPRSVSVGSLFAFFSVLGHQNRPRS